MVAEPAVHVSTADIVQAMLAGQHVSQHQPLKRLQRPQGGHAASITRLGTARLFLAWWQSGSRCMHATLAVLPHFKLCLQAAGGLAQQCASWQGDGCTDRQPHGGGKCQPPAAAMGPSLAMEPCQAVASWEHSLPQRPPMTLEAETLANGASCSSAGSQDLLALP